MTTWAWIGWTLGLTVVYLALTVGVGFLLWALVLHLLHGELCRCEDCEHDRPQGWN